jgi:hypothetical protein
MKSINDFTGLYSLQKTLRFELKPIAQTLEHIQAHGLLEKDQHRADSYVEVKKIIDRYHKALIERVLSDVRLDVDAKGNPTTLLEDYYFHYMCKSKDEAQVKRFEEVQKKLRKIIADSFKKDDRFKRIDKKELITKDLVEFLTDDAEKTLVAEFANFTTYFTGFHENRKNMYSEEEQSTAIAYRLIHENLPRFIDNMMVFDKVKTSPVAQQLPELYANFESYLNVMEVAEMFQLDYFNTVLAQSQIDVYNAIIGGRSLEGDVKLKGLNEYINLYNQQQKDRTQRLPKLKPLYKQILSDRNAVSWLPEQFGSDNELLEKVQQAYQSLNELVLNRQKQGEHSLRELLQNLSAYDLSKIYIRNDQQLTELSQHMYGTYDVISNALVEDLKRQSPRKKNEADETYLERLNKVLKSQGSISVAEINRCVQAQSDLPLVTVQEYYAQLGAVESEYVKCDNLYTVIENAYNSAKELLNTTYPEGKNIAQDQASVDLIKNLLDAFKALQRYVKPLLGNGAEAEKDEKFYGEFVALWEELNHINPLYNMVRNYMTRKPYSTEKIKLNFENNGMLLNGWVDSKTENSDNGTQYGGYLFRKENSIGEYDYFLGISADTKLFRKDTLIESSDISQYERLDYYQLKSQTIYGSAYQGDYLSESQAIISTIDDFVCAYGGEDLKTKVNDDRAKKQPRTNTAKGYLNFIRASHIYNDLLKDADFNKANNALLESIKKTLSSFKRVAAAQELANKEFALFDELMGEIEILVKEKVFSYNAVSQKEFDLVTNRSNKPLYLFKITNKDLSFAETFAKGLRKSRGTENLHTLYFKALMGGTQNVFDIGTGSVYYREKSISYPEDKMKKGHHYDALKDRFQYPIISNRRYAYDKFQFHLSIFLNYQAEKNTDINTKANEYIQQNEDLHIIGIDRGERHLLYVTVIDLQGRIKEQYSLNEIINEYNGATYRTNYHTLLSEREGERQKARQSWKTIENIKDLKEGYLSQVVHKITDLMIKYQAIVVLEDLNMGFKRGRQKVESSVYQQFEKMLIDKLNYLADKKAAPADSGSVLHAYQLTNKFDSFKKMGKQNGFLFYIPAWNTSKIDPVTGFVNLFDNRYETREKSKAFFEKFHAIRYNTQKDWFEFAFDYSAFTTKAEGTRTHWTLCTYGKRVETYRDSDQNSQWVSREVDLTEMFKDFFAQYNIDVHSDLRQAISSQNTADFFKRLHYLFKLTLQLRNSKTGTEVDYMQSPVMDEEGNFYNSETCSNELPRNADANGAYNIARKGLYYVRKIKSAEDLKNLKLSLTNKEWLHFVQTRPYAEE